MVSPKAICVFCGSSPGKSAVYLKTAAALGQALAEHNCKLIYGGGERGCMGAVAAAAIESGGQVLGVIPRVMVTTKPHGHLGEGQEAQPPEHAHSADDVGTRTLNQQQADRNSRMETIIVETMHERRCTMAASCDGFIGLPGGYRTFEEVMEMINWAQLGVHSKPVVLLNANGFWNPFRAMIDTAVEDGFISEKGRRFISFIGEKGDDAKSLAKEAVMELENLMTAFDKDGLGYRDWDSLKEPVKEEAIMAEPLANSAKELGQPFAVSVPDLTFSYSPDGPPALTHVNLSLVRGSRCLLIGANGSGKSTLLRLLAGKRLCDSSVRVFGRDVFRDAPRGITYLGTEWAMNPVVRGDIVVSHFLDSVGGYRHKARRDRLLDILDIDLDWHMHQISDGERRRVQLCMGLMEEWDLLLLDEVTVDLDVQVRSDLLSFLEEETKQRNATIIYATHIFDGLQKFPTHIVHMRLGSTTTSDALNWPPSAAQMHLIPPIPAQSNSPNGGAGSAGDDFSPLLHIALQWLREDRVARIEKEKQEGRKRGARSNTETTDSEKFFRKYDYAKGATR
ncbi:hypothetical protein K437DRAFT_268571 [Tilletiaria anomala UBC 951]|uniref:ABC transporter domain-containing protein n=1 Tax=Tilletiaria anomala (strain ATCC 24038 / CBS 436.72 / UBC 951) TaxID=1037660 RepID=A0A066VXB9_TILAU|nr:uncharacterized protein K437DRAFT_268571 [Tilletiaria anomala UBC 951]KDN44918.1 hypothetical protein K437DRAFT_268571 [Tilletiaria anomala UBC 951]